MKLKGISSGGMPDMVVMPLGIREKEFGGVMAACYQCRWACDHARGQSFMMKMGISGMFAI